MLRNALYNVLISKLTNAGYSAFLDQVEPGARILDIGVGNGLMLRRHHELIAAKELTILGLDLDGDYLSQCQRLIEEFGLGDRMKVERRNFLEKPVDGPFDVVFFSQSLPLIDRKQTALDTALELLAPGGHLAFFHTIQRQSSRFLEFIKPRLKYLSTIEFGRVIYQADFEELLGRFELEAVSNRKVHWVSPNSEAHVMFFRPLETAVAEAESSGGLQAQA